MKYLIAALALMAVVLVGFAAADTNYLTQKNDATGDGQYPYTGEVHPDVKQTETNCALVFGEGNEIDQSNAQTTYAWKTEQTAKNTAGIIGSFNEIDQSNTAFAPKLNTRDDGSVADGNMKQDQHNMGLIVGNDNELDQTNWANIEENNGRNLVSQSQTNEALLIGADNVADQSNKANANTGEVGAPHNIENEGNVPVTQTQKNIGLMIGTQDGNIKSPHYKMDDIEYPHIAINMPSVKIDPFPCIHVPECKDCKE